MSNKQSDNIVPYHGPSELIGLHIHTFYSVLDGISSPSQYFEQCAERKWPAIAITEHGVLNSIPDCYFASKEYGVKYVVGCELYFNAFEPLRRQRVDDGISMHDIKGEDPELASRISRNRHITVLCKDMIGYGNLLKINKHAWEHGFYYKPRVWLDVLRRYKEGLIFLSGCLNGPVSHELRNGNYSSSGYIIGAIDYVKKFKEAFGDDFYIELQMPGVPGDVPVFKKLVAIADHQKIKTVLTGDCHYLTRKDHELQMVMMAIDQNTTVDDPNLFHVNSSEQFFKTRAELWHTFKDGEYSKGVPDSVFEDACDNTLEVADKCSGFVPNLEPKLPRIENADEELCRICLRELKSRGLDKDDVRYEVDGRFVTYREQMEIELKRFIEKGFSSYFLITRDLIKCSIENGYSIGPSRGSSGGSIVCFLLDIVTLDSLKWGTSFDRFLSPSRGGNMLKVTMD